MNELAKLAWISTIGITLTLLNVLVVVFGIAPYYRGKHATELKECHFNLEREKLVVHGLKSQLGDELREMNAKNVELNAALRTCKTTTS